MPGRDPCHAPFYLCAQVPRWPGAPGTLLRDSAERLRGRRDGRVALGAAVGFAAARGGSPAPVRVAPGAAETCGAPQQGHWAAWRVVTVRQGGGG